MTYTSHALIDGRQLARLLRAPRADIPLRRTPVLPATENRCRETTQTPQGLDAQHSGELFPVNESRLTSARLGLGLAGKPFKYADGGLCV
jgi:hypothetical protein